MSSHSARFSVAEVRRFEFGWDHCFHNLPNPFSLTMDLGSSQLLTEIRTRNLPRVKGGLRASLALLPSVSRLSRKCGILDVSQPYGPPQPITRITFNFFALYVFEYWELKGNVGHWRYHSDVPENSTMSMQCSQTLVCLNHRTADDSGVIFQVPHI
jgi:hypothetical protein